MLSIDTKLLASAVSEVTPYSENSCGCSPYLFDAVTEEKKLEEIDLSLFSRREFLCLLESDFFFQAAACEQINTVIADADIETAGKIFF